MESIGTQNKSCKVEFTAEEKEFAEKYQVEPKLIRMIAEIVSEHTAGITELIKLMRGETDQKLEAKLEEIETKAEPEEKIEQRGPGSTVENMVEQWLRKQSYRTKLALVIFTGYMQGDHGANDVTERIDNEYEREVLKMIQNPDSSLSSEDIIMSGIAAELFVWSKNL